MSSKVMEGKGKVIRTRPGGCNTRFREAREGQSSERLTRQGKTV